MLGYYIGSLISAYNNRSVTRCLEDDFILLEHTYISEKRVGKLQYVRLRLILLVALKGAIFTNTKHFL